MLYTISITKRKRAISMKDKTTAIILSALLGGLGVDRFYLGYTGMGVLKLLTGGCFGILWILDTSNAAAPKATAIDPYDELKKIAQLKEQGIINEEEYAKMKADCLAKL